jgi:ATP-dependent Clp protease ATP-binding subunit ClpA
MYAYMTSHALELMVEADAASRRRGGTELDEQDLLAALAADERMISRFFARLDARLDRLHEVGHPAASSGGVDPSSPRSMSQSAKRAIALAWAEAHLLRDDYLCPEHLVLGIFAEGGRGAELLKDAGLDRATARSHLIRYPPPVAERETAMTPALRRVPGEPPSWCAPTH